MDFVYIIGTTKNIDFRYFKGSNLRNSGLDFSFDKIPPAVAPE